MQSINDKISSTPLVPLPVYEQQALALISEAILPGVYGLLGHTGNVLDIAATDHVLFIAQNAVAGALTLVREFGCMVTALTSNRQQVGEAHQRVTVLHSSLSSLVADNQTFDVVITEGAFAASSDKSNAATELFAVVRAGGRLALTEPIVYRDLVSEELQPLFRQLPSLAGARPAAVYRTQLGEQGFTAFVTEERRQNLLRSVDALRQRLLLRSAEDTDVGSDDDGAAIQVATQMIDLIERGVASYVLISAEKP